LIFAELVFSSMLCPASQMFDKMEAMALKIPNKLKN
jgi:hypothetical protein